MKTKKPECRTKHAKLRTMRLILQFCNTFQGWLRRGLLFSVLLRSMLYPTKRIDNDGWCRVYRPFLFFCLHAFPVQTYTRFSSLFPFAHTSTYVTTQRSTTTHTTTHAKLSPSPVWTSAYPSEPSDDLVFSLVLKMMILHSMRYIYVSSVCLPDRSSSTWSDRKSVV